MQTNPIPDLSVERNEGPDGLFRDIYVKKGRLEEIFF
jgi:hypothetical protein